MTIDTKLSLAPEEMEYLFERPIMKSISDGVIENPDISVEAAEIAEAILNASANFCSLSAVILGCLEVVAVLVANAERLSSTGAERFEALIGGLLQ